MQRLVSYFLNVAYLLLLVVISPLILWAVVRKGKYREGYAQKLFGRVPVRVGDRPCAWLHAVSVGEVNVLQTLVAEFSIRHPKLDIVISTTTKTGYELAKRRYAEHTVFYCPLDFSWAVRNALSRIRPTMLILAELELWPNMVMLAKQSGAKVAIVNGRLSDSSFRGYGRVRPLVAWLLKKIDCIVAQDDTTAKRFLALGAKPTAVQPTGSLKYDGAETDRLNARTNSLRKLAGIQKEDIVFLAGSTQSPEEAAALSAFMMLEENHPTLKLILVPRHPERFDEVVKLLDENGTPWQRRSQLETETQESNQNKRITLVDTVGELGAWWGLADIGFVGGSFGARGGQNMIEPAAYGVATCYGPNTKNFRDIVAAFAKEDAAVVVEDATALTQFVQNCLSDRETASALGQRARSFVQTQLGATRRTCELLEPFIDSSSEASVDQQNAA